MGSERRSPRSPRRRLVAWGLVLGGTVALFAHVRTWYSPRERAASMPAGAPARLLAGNYDLRLWVPYPHQNLDVLDEALGGIEDTTAAWSEALDIEIPRLPRFGPFRAPPARELTLAADLDGRRFAAVARVYPAIAVIARLAGKVAGNPWLGGGKVEVSGRAARVSWDGTLWRLRSAPASDDQSPETVVDVPEPALARLEIGPRCAIAPRGVYRLRRDGAGLHLAAAVSTWPPAFELAKLGAARVPQTMAVLLRGEDSLEGGRTTRGAVVFAQKSGLPLPRMAIFHAGNGGRWKLPAEGILELLRGDLPTTDMAGGKLLGLDGESVEAARALEPVWRAASEGNLVEYALFRPEPAVEWSGRIADELAEVPIVGERHAKRWRAWQRALAPFQRFTRVELAVGGGEGQLMLELAREH